jgi:hypothetical protein
MAGVTLSACHLAFDVVFRINHLLAEGCFCSRYGIRQPNRRPTETRDVPERFHVTRPGRACAEDKTKSDCQEFQLIRSHDLYLSNVEPILRKTGDHGVELDQPAQAGRRYGSTRRLQPMFTRPVWHRRVITVVLFLALLWFAGTGNTQVLRVMALALAFWVPFSLHFFWRLKDANERDDKF